MRIEISIRHGGLAPEQHDYLHDKAEKLLKYFGRLMEIEVAVDHHKHAWQVEILVSAEHKHDFVAASRDRPRKRPWTCASTRSKHQLRKYKEKVQHHKGDTALGEMAPASPDLAEPPEADLT